MQSELARMADLIEAHCHGPIYQPYERTAAHGSIQLPPGCVVTECECGEAFIGSDVQEVRALWAAHVAEAIRAQQPAASGEVVPLVWEETTPGSWRATSIGLRYYAYYHEGEWHSYAEGYQPWASHSHDTLESAQQAADENYVERLRTATLPTYDQGRKDGIEEADIPRARHIAAEELCRENWKPGVKAGMYEDIMAGKCDDEPFVRIAIRALGEARS